MTHPFCARVAENRQALHGPAECHAAAMPPHRDVESDLRHRLARDAQIGVAQLRHGNLTTPDSVIDYLVERSFGSADRILDARDLLGEPDLEARALLLMASRRAADPIPPGPPKPFAAPDAPRPRREDGPA